MACLIEPIWQGFISYSQSLKRQEDLKLKAKGQRKVFLLGFECGPCVTLGLRGGGDDLLLSSKEYGLRGVEVVRIKRGGQATLHAPGQLVIYPIMDLKVLKIPPRCFLQKLEQITIRVLKSYGVSAKRTEAFAGLSTAQGKIAFFGVHISEGVSQHGLALNVRNDLKLFDMIKSCGQALRRHDRLCSYGLETLTLQQVFACWCRLAQEFF